MVALKTGKRKVTRQSTLHFSTITEALKASEKKFSETTPVHYSYSFYFITGFREEWGGWCTYLKVHPACTIRQVTGRKRGIKGQHCEPLR